MVEGLTATLSRAAAAELDASDPLRAFRDRFVIDPDIVYLDGNSLGCLPRSTVARLERLVAQWGERGVRAWDEGWLELPLEVGDRLGEAVLGAAPGQTVIGDSTTVCFYKLVSAALDARPGRTEIVTDVGNFPTDRYVLEGLARARASRSSGWTASRIRATSPLDSARTPRWSPSRTCPTARPTSPTWLRSTRSPTTPAP